MTDPRDPDGGWESVPPPSGLEDRHPSGDPADARPGDRREPRSDSSDSFDSSDRPESQPALSDSSEGSAPQSGRFDSSEGSAPQSGRFDSSEGSAPQSGSSDRPTPGAAPSGRPAPQYGEYAPEGWVNPVLVEQERREREAASRRAEQESDARRWTEAGGSGDGVRRAGAVPPGRGADGRTSQTGGRTGTARGLPRDTVITVLLLAFGAISVVQSLTGISSVAGQVAQQIAMRYTTLAHPQALVAATAWSAVVGAVILVLAAWWSIVRLRHRKTSFWVPLVAGALAGLVSTILYVVVVMHDPAFAAYLVQHGGA